jgi:hypothetical protein
MIEKVSPAIWHMHRIERFFLGRPGQHRFYKEGKPPRLAGTEYQDGGTLILLKRRNLKLIEA